MAVLLAILLPMFLAAGFLLARALYRRPGAVEDLTPVTRQHIALFQGGELNEAAVEAVKRRFRDLLERGDLAAVEASLRPGTGYLYQVRALAEIGTDQAGQILERQLHRRLSDDDLEQAWYRIDLAGGLRGLNRQESLPELLRCGEHADLFPLGQFFAAETICFLGFAGYLTEAESPLGKAALRLLHRALVGLRCGVQPQVVVEARLGDTLECLWDHRPGEAQPLLVRVASETLRFLRRVPHARALFSEERSDLEAFDLQVSHLSALEPALDDYLQEAAPSLLARLTRADDAELPDLLEALGDLRAEAGAQVLGLLRRPSFVHHEPAVELLTWSRDPRVGPWLRDWMRDQVPLARRARRRRRALPPRQPSVGETIPYAATLRALRGHPSLETERFLMQAAADWDPTYRAAAVSSLGWWEPLLRGPVLETLQESRRDPSLEVRQAARAALARLGERQALQWFRQALTSENPQQVHEMVHYVAAEGLTLLWPDLDHLADADDGDVAHHAREALEQLCEEMDKRGN